MSVSPSGSKSHTPDFDAGGAWMLDPSLDLEDAPKFRGVNRTLRISILPVLRLCLCLVACGVCV